MTNEKIKRLLKAVAKKLGDNGYSSYKAVEDELRPMLAPLLEAGERHGHLVCEDCFYSCPLAEDYCGGEEKVCNCGYAEYEAAWKQILNG